VQEEAPLSEVMDALMLSAQKRVIVLNEEREVQGIISDVDLLRSIHPRDTHVGLHHQGFRPLLLVHI